MSKIEKDIRVSVKTGTSFPARVVSTFQGKASVMMLSNGAIYRDLDVVGGSVVIGQNVKIDFTTHKPTVLSGEFSNQQVASSFGNSGSNGGNGSGNFTEGPGIDILSARIGFGGDSLLIYNSDGNPVDEYAADDAGLTTALAAMGSGDVLELPNIEITGGPWTITDGTLRGFSRYGSILHGTVVVGTSCKLENLSIVVQDYASALIGVTLNNYSRVSGCLIDLLGQVNTIGIYSITASICYANDNIVYAYCSGTGYGYGYYVGMTGGALAGMDITGGLVRATTAPVWEQTT